MSSAPSRLPESDAHRTLHPVEDELKRIYANRFSGVESYRLAVWHVLVSDFFSRYLKSSDTVLDLGCGYGEFINTIKVGTKYGMDLNPTAAERLNKDVHLIQQDCSSPWPLRENSLDVVFTSNFFEHLPSKSALQETLCQVKRCLKPGGRLIALGPNVRYLSGEYWDFFDHHIALTDLSLAEAMQMAGLEVEWKKARFSPYSMSQGFRPPLWTLRLFLKLPALWTMFGKQFLLIARSRSRRSVPTNAFLSLQKAFGLAK